MLKAIMSVHRRVTGTKNIGDYIQAVAANQFMKANKFVDRDELKFYNGECCKLIMNGWFMHDTTAWPPSDKIIPLITSFHITPGRKDSILTSEGVAYLKKHQPIGCRDKATKRFLEAKGISAYFSSCLTLTLGRTYASKPDKQKILFVDPLIPYLDKPFGTTLRKIDFMFSIANARKIILLGVKFIRAFPSLGGGVKAKIKAFAAAAIFFRHYIKMFSEEALLEADYLSNRISWRSVNKGMNEDVQLMQLADKTLRAFEKYPLVVTSRIHCALPCIAMGTQVIFVNDKAGRDSGAGLEMDNGRFDGLIDYFNLLSFDRDWKFIADFDCNGQITAETRLPVNDTWKADAQELASMCEKFAEE